MDITEATMRALNGDLKESKNKVTEAVDGEDIAYYTYILGYDLLHDKLEQEGPECDVTFEKAYNIAKDFLNSEEYKTSNKSPYDALVDYLKNNKLIENKNETYLTWDEIYKNAEGTTFGQSATKIKDEARYEMEELMKKDGIDIDSFESVEDAIDEYVSTHNILFDEHGAIANISDSNTMKKN